MRAVGLVKREPHRWPGDNRRERRLRKMDRSELWMHYNQRLYNRQTKKISAYVCDLMSELWESGRPHERSGG